MKDEKYLEFVILIIDSSFTGKFTLSGKIFVLIIFELAFVELDDLFFRSRSRSRDLLEDEVFIFWRDLDILEYFVFTIDWNSDVSGFKPGFDL